MQLNIEILDVGWFTSLPVHNEGFATTLAQALSGDWEEVRIVNNGSHYIVYYRKRKPVIERGNTL